MCASRRRQSWIASTVISDEIGEDERYVKNVESLLRSEHTIPFIARYRKEMTGDMSTEKLYKIKEQINRLDNLAKKIEKALVDIDKIKCLTPELSEAISSCTSATTLEQVTAAYKPGKKKSRAEQAKSLGLGELADNLICGKHVDFQSFAGSNANLKTVKQVIDGTRDILAERLRTNKTILEWCEKISKHGHDNFIECVESKSKVVVDGSKKEKFDQYFNWKRNVGSIMPFHMMALNRGEAQKVLSVKVNIANRGQHIIKQECLGILKNVRHEIQMQAVDDACSRLIFPLVQRRIRSGLTEKAVEGSVDVFADNLKHLLLTRPITGIKIIALDPGFTHGCKVAILSKTGQVLKTDVIYLLDSGRSIKASSFRKMDEFKLQKLQMEYHFDTIAIGNGTACRETERAVGKMISEKMFTSPVKYTIVDERGASVYSVNKLAQEELPNLGTNLRSAVSIGRRVLDPLSEYVKIEPQHLGVGQYQHDIPQTKLKERLDAVVTEAVSFSGLDVNTCEQHMLERIAGLTKARAKAIIAARKSSGPFVNREQIKSVKGIGPKSYEQCVGFLRVYATRLNRNDSDSEPEYKPESESRKRKMKSTSKTSSKVMKLNVQYLDQTSVHPESYKIAMEIIKEQGLKLSDVGTKEFVSMIRKVDPASLSVNCTEGTIKCILTALSQELDTDYRDQFSKPIFKDNLTSAASITPGTELEGRVSNVTHFGAFVDVGLEKDGLVHISKMRGQTLSLGQRVKVAVEKKDHKGIGLVLINVMQ